MSKRTMLAQPASPLVEKLASLAEFAGIPVKALTLGAVDWAQTSATSLDRVLAIIEEQVRQREAISFPWNRARFLLAVDPGSVCMGWAVYRLPGILPGREVMDTFLPTPLPGEVVDAGVWCLSRGRTNDIPMRIARFVDFAQRFPYARSIRALALEDQFIGSNPHTALIIGRARGWVEHWATRDLEIADFFTLSPSEIKQGFAGRGNASKEMMTARAEQLFDLQHIPKSFRDNAADAIAIGSVAYKVYMRLQEQAIALQP